MISVPHRLGGVERVSPPKKLSQGARSFGALSDQAKYLFNSIKKKTKLSGLQPFSLCCLLELPLSLVGGSAHG